MMFEGDQMAEVIRVKKYTKLNCRENWAGLLYILCFVPPITTTSSKPDFIASHYDLLGDFLDIYLGLPHFMKLEMGFSFHNICSYPTYLKYEICEC